MGFAINGLFCLLAYPQNMIVFWLVFLGFYTRIGLILAPLFKLPVGAGLYVWLFLWNNPASVREPDNWPVYLWLVISWLIALAYLKRRESHRRENGKTESKTLLREEAS